MFLILIINSQLIHSLRGEKGPTSKKVFLRITSIDFNLFTDCEPFGDRKVLKTGTPVHIRNLSKFAQINAEQTKGQKNLPNKQTTKNNQHESHS